MSYVEISLLIIYESKLVFHVYKGDPFMYAQKFTYVCT